jgi:hypothetical protein
MIYSIAYRLVNFCIGARRNWPKIAVMYFMHFQIRKGFILLGISTRRLKEFADKIQASQDEALRDSSFKDESLESQASRMIR